jgi:hypothetical protein
MANRKGHSGKVDANQAPIIEALEAIGVKCVSLAGVGDGVDDLLCGDAKADVGLYLIECKAPGEGLTPKQKSFHEWFPIRNHIAHSPAEAIEIAMFYRKKGRKNGRD